MTPTVRFDRETLAGVLRGLPNWKQEAFALAVCERLFPLYVEFHRSTAWGDPSVLRNALDLAWSHLERKDGSREFPRIVSESEAQAPDTDDFSSEYTSAALDAALSTAGLMKLLHRFDADGVLEIAQAAFDSAYLRAPLASGASTATVSDHQEALESRAVQDELAAQKRDLELLAGLHGDFAQNVTRLRDEWLHGSIHDA